jgi:calcium-dependent protein kinase
MDQKKISIKKSNFVFYKKHSITRDYSFGEKIGSGSFGSVRIATHKNSGHKRAVKIIKKDEQEDEEKLFLEVDILAKLSHPNIMLVFECYEDSTNFYIISEICEGGELFDCIAEKGHFTEKDAALVMKQILSAINYSHDNNIVHRDLKPENILLDFKSDIAHLKIIDWGGARYFKKNKKMSKINGTPYYIAPEVLDEKYDEKCDIWSCGVILYILLSGYPPFNGDTDVDIMKSVRKGVYDFDTDEWKTVSSEAKDLISNMLKYDPAQRFSAKQVLSHVWFKKAMENAKVTLNESVTVNMKKFKQNKRLEEAAINFIATQLIGKEEKHKLQEQFENWDKNGDGVLSRDEIYDGFCKLYGEVIAAKEVDEIMKNVDLDGNGYIDYNEFLTVSINRDKVLMQENLECAFKAFDIDNSGKISLDELMHVFKNKNDKAAFEKMIKKVDKNDDGEISFDEFKVIMTNFFL